MSLPGQNPPPASGSEPFLTAKQAAQFLGMTLKALYARVERGLVPAYRLGRRLLFRVSELQALPQRR